MKKLLIGFYDSGENFIEKYLKTHFKKKHTNSVYKFSSEQSLYNHLYKIGKLDIYLVNSSNNCELLVYVNLKLNDLTSNCSTNIMYKINKPIEYRKLELVFNNINKILYEYDSRFLIEKNDAGYYKILFDEIVYIETCNRNTLIHTGSKEILSYHNMKEHESLLDNHFYRCHSSFIVNMDFIKSIEYPNIVLFNKELVPISKNRRKDFIINYKQYYIL